MKYRGISLIVCLLITATPILKKAQIDETVVGIEFNSEVIPKYSNPALINSIRKSLPKTNEQRSKGLMVIGTLIIGGSWIIGKKKKNKIR